MLALKTLTIQTTVICISTPVYATTTDLWVDVIGQRGRPSGRG